WIQSPYLEQRKKNIIIGCRNFIPVEFSQDADGCRACNPRVRSLGARAGSDLLRLRPFANELRERMDFVFTDEQRAIQQSARDFAQAELHGLADELDKTAKPVPAEWLRRYAGMGFLGINTSSDFGGLGLPLLDALIAMEEFAKVS